MISKDRAMEILKIYKDGKHDLFNWCREYEDFINKSVCTCVSMEWEYMLKKSYEDSESPCNYEDLDLFNKDLAVESIIDILKNDKNEDELKDLFEKTNEENNLKIKTIGDYEVYLKSLDNYDLRDLCQDEFKIYEDSTDSEVYEWWIIKDPLKYRLEEQGQIFLNDAWGRCTTGQSISLDYCCIKAFLSMLKDIIN